MSNRILTIIMMLSLAFLITSSKIPYYSFVITYGLFAFLLLNIVNVLIYFKVKDRVFDINKINGNYEDITKNEKDLFLILINNNMKRIKRNGLLNYIKLAISIIATSMTLLYNTQEIPVVMKYINISLLIVLAILYNKTFGITKSKNNELTSIIGNNEIARENILKIKEELSEVK